MIGAQQIGTHCFVPCLPKPIQRSAIINTSSLPSTNGKTKMSLSAISAVETIVAAPRRESERSGGGGDALLLPLEICRDALPKHVAVIMDGNVRWAASRGLPAAAGHEAGYLALQLLVKLSCKWGIRVLTVFAFSSENWFRPKPEVDFLMMLFENVLKSNLAGFLRQGIRIRIIGDSSKLPKSLQKMAAELEQITCNKSSKLDLIVAISYSGRTDIVQACRKIAQKVENGMLKPDEITESRVAQELETSCAVGYPYPDLLIRTSGELRLSNFLLWELAYTELYFAQSYWPDFGEDEYAEALRSFQKRKRRFGSRTTTITL